MYSLYCLADNKEFLLGRFSSLKEADAMAFSWRLYHYRIYISMCGIKRLVKERKEGGVIVSE